MLGYGGGDMVYYRDKRKGGGSLNSEALGEIVYRGKAPTTAAAQQSSNLTVQRESSRGVTERQIVVPCCGRM